MAELQYLDAGAGCAWDATLLEPLAELNAEILGAYAGTAAGLQELWHSLSESARLRLAFCPYLLADAGFARAELWAGVPWSGVRENLARARPGPKPAAAESPASLATPLMRRVLLFAWHLARSNPHTARIALGMNAACTVAVARCRLADLEALAEQRPAWIRARWSDRPELWRAWLLAAARGGPHALERCQLWGLQALAAEVVGPELSIGKR